MTMTYRIDPRIVQSLEAQLKECRDRATTYPKGSAQREAAEAYIKQQEEQLKRVTAGYMGAPQ